MFNTIVEIESLLNLACGTVSSHPHHMPVEQQFIVDTHESAYRCIQRLSRPMDAQSRAEVSKPYLKALRKNINKVKRTGVLGRHPAALDAVLKAGALLKTLGF